MERDWDKVILKTEKSGELRLNMRDIIKMTPVNVEKFKKGKYWFKDPQSTRYFWSPNGYGLEQGEVYYQNVWVLYNQFAAGVTDYFSLSLGVLPLFLLHDGSSPVWITPKFSIPVIHDKINIGAGILAGTAIKSDQDALLELDDTNIFGILYGLITFGSPNINLSIGVGYGFTEDSWAKTRFINVNGMIRTGPRGYIITENYFMNMKDGFIMIAMFGGRRIINKIALDYGLFIPIKTTYFNSGIVVIPWLGITIPISKTRGG